MNPSDRHDNFDELISSTFGRNELKFDFDKWQQAHPDSVCRFQSKTKNRSIPAAKWRFIMKNNLFKLAAAAVILIALILTFSYNGASPDGATIAWADVMKSIDNMSNAMWIHCRTSSPDINENKEFWYSKPLNIESETKYDNSVSFKKDHIKYQYAPDSNTITVSNYISTSNAFAAMPGNPAEFTETFVEMIVAMLEPINFDIETKNTESTINGQKFVEITHTAIRKENAATICKKAIIKIKINQTINLLSELAIYADNSDSVTDITIAFDYPSNGPNDIYNLGVPIDANIIDNTNDQLLEKLDKYRNARDAFPDKRVTIIKEKTYRYYMIYHSGKKVRIDDIYTPEPTPENIDDILFRENTLYDYNYIVKTAKEIGKFRYYTDNIEIFDEVYSYELENKSNLQDLTNNNWILSHKKELSKLPGYKHEPWIDIVMQYWPDQILEDSDHRIKLSVIEDSYSLNNNFICIQSLENGNSYKGKIIYHPLRSKYYLDPSKDYICHRKVLEYKKDGQWQQDKDWLKDVTDNNGYSDQYFIITEMKKYKNTSTGQWYATIIAEKQFNDMIYDCDYNYDLKPDKFITIIENPEIDDTLFDPQYIIQNKQ